MGKNNQQPGHDSGDLAGQQSGTPSDTPNVPPQTMYETVEMTPEEIATQNAAYKAMGLPCVIVDVSRFSAKLERQTDGTYKRTKLTRTKAARNETETD